MKDVLIFFVGFIVGYYGRPSIDNAIKKIKVMICGKK